MKKYYYISLIAITIYSCTGSAPLTAKDSLAIDSMKNKIMDSLKSETDKTVAKDLMDTAGLYKSPVKIISANMITKEYSSYRSVELEYQNVSNKTISGIKFSWYGLNAFGDPADMGGYVDGVGGGFMDDDLGPGEKTSSDWDILSRNGKKIVLAWPTEVAFTDGTKWQLKK